MRILFASPHRDLLECFKKLLEPDTGETVTAFDGTQVIYLLAKESFDAVILDSHIQRVDSKEITERIRRKNIPVIVLTYGSLSSHILTEEPVPNAYLPYPFDSEKIKAVIANVLAKAAGGEIIKAGNAQIEVSEFRIKDSPGLTADEIDVFKSVTEGKSVSEKDRVYISSLNAKFAKAGADTRIKYRAKKGFEQVTENE